MHRMSIVGVALVLMTSIGAGGADEKRLKMTPDEAKQWSENQAVAKKALHAARTFTDAVCKKDDKAAYQLMTPEFRKATTADAFANQMSELRQSAKLEKLPPLTGYVQIKTKAGEPRRARLVEHHFVNIIFQGRKPPERIGMELVEQNGGWMVSDVKGFSQEQEASEFGDTYRKAAGRDIYAAIEATSDIRAVVEEINEGAVILDVDLRTPDDKTEKRTYKVDEKTQVVSMSMRTVPGSGGKSFQVPGRPKNGTVKDLRVGDAVIAQSALDDDERITSMNVDPTKPNKNAGGPGL